MELLMNEFGELMMMVVFRLFPGRSRNWDIVSALATPTVCLVLPACPEPPAACRQIASMPDKHPATVEATVP